MNVSVSVRRIALVTTLAVLVLSGLAGPLQAAAAPPQVSLAETANVAEIKSRLQSGGTVLAEEANLLNFGNATEAIHN